MENDDPNGRKLVGKRPFLVGLVLAVRKWPNRFSLDHLRSAGWPKWPIPGSQNSESTSNLGRNGKRRPQRTEAFRETAPFGRPSVGGSQMVQPIFFRPFAIRRMAEMADPGVPKFRKYVKSWKEWKTTTPTDGSFSGNGPFWSA